MKRLILTSLILLAGCAGADAGVPEDAHVNPTTGYVELPDYSHEYLVQPATEAPQAVIDENGFTVIHADPAVLFRGTEIDTGSFKVDDISTPEQDAETMKHPDSMLEWHPPMQGNLGRAAAPLSECLQGPGFQLGSNFPINSRNTGQIIGPCYEDTNNPIATNHDCEFPNFTTFTVPWAFDIQLNQQFCTAGVIGGPPGTVALVGDAQFKDAFDSWGAATGIPFSQVASGSTELISLICAPSSTQNSFGQSGVLASGGPWGFLTKKTLTASQTPQFVGSRSDQFADHSTPSGFNYPITKMRDYYVYGAGIMWLDDLHLSNLVTSCSVGKTTAQREKMRRTLSYAIGAHETGHILGFWHAGSGIMKPTFGCADLGDGSAIFETPVSGAYGTNYKVHAKGLVNQTMPPLSCNAPVPLDHNSAEDQSQVFVLN